VANRDARERGERRARAMGGRRSRGRAREATRGGSGLDRCPARRWAREGGARGGRGDVRATRGARDARSVVARGIDAIGARAQARGRRASSNLNSATRATAGSPSARERESERTTDGKRYASERRAQAIEKWCAEMGTTPEKVVTMYLDEKFKSATIEGELLAKCENLKTLSCASCGLTSLAGFPTLPNLVDLSLNDNRIAGGLDGLRGCVGLKQLSLANNKLADVDELKPLADDLTLSVLELEANPLTQSDDYHEKVMTMMPTLNVLDGRDEFGKEIDEDSEEDEDDDDDEDDDEDDDDDDDDDEDDDEDEDEEDEEEEEELGLAALYGDKPLEDEDDDEAFIEDEDPESEDIDEEESDDDDEDERPSKMAKA